jgi:hypothetical protein
MFVIYRRGLTIGLLNICVANADEFHEAALTKVSYAHPKRRGVVERNAVARKILA